MKKSNILIGITACGLLFTGLVGCGTDDLSTPVIVLNGDTEVFVKLGESYTDEGATATDDEDGDISTNIVVDESDVNTDDIGEYKVTYSVSDAAGNTAIEERTVFVYAANTSYAGTYSVHETYTDEFGATDIIDYVVTITASGVEADKILIENLGDYDPPITVEATISGNLGDQLDINDLQGGIQFDGSGSVTLGSITSFIFDLNYTQDGTLFYTSEATFTKL